MRLRRRKVELVVERAYREGFLSTVYGGLPSGLSYASDSGLYSYNPIHHMAYDAGRSDCEAILAARSERFTVRVPRDIEVSPEVWVKAYGMARIAHRRGSR